MAKRCPICREPAPARSDHAPFCSARCRDVDLGTWLQEGYRITRPMMPWEPLAEPSTDDDDPEKQGR